MELLRRTPTLEFGKTKTAAARHMLSDNPATWVSELTAALYKEHPWLGRYMVNVEIDSQDDQRGYMHGKFLVMPASDVPPTSVNTVTYAAQPGQAAGPAPVGQAGGQPPAGQAAPGQGPRGQAAPGPGQAPESQGAQPGMDPAAAPSGPPKQDALRIPIIVREKKAFPFDVLFAPDGAAQPLSESRVAAIMYDANSFSQAPTEGMPNSAGGDALPDTPNAATGISGFGVSSNNSSTRLAQDPIKTASVYGSIYAHVSPDEASVTEMLEKLAADPITAVAIRSVGATLRGSLEKLAAVSEPAGAASVYVGPHVSELPLAMEAVGGGFRIWGLPGDEGVVKISHVEAVDIPVEIRNAAINDGYTVLNGGDFALPRVLEDGHVKEASATGLYTVFQRGGGSSKAAVIGDVIGLDGRDSALRAVAPEGGGVSFQTKVAGVPGEFGAFASPSFAKHASPDYLNGDVCLWMPSLGKLSEPFEVTQTVTMGGETYANIQHPLYGASRMVKTATAAPMMTEHQDQRYFLIPEDSQFIPAADTSRYIEDIEQVENLKHQGTFNKTASLRHTYDGGFAVYRSQTGAWRGYDSEMEAAVILARLGDSDGGAKEKLAAARGGETVDFYTSGFMTRAHMLPLYDVETPWYKAASSVSLDLVKEAAALASDAEQDTVDAVLSLNFITPENIQGYFNGLPELESAVTRLAELVIGVRLGLKDVPEAAVSAALTGLDRTIDGLKKLQMRQEYDSQQ